MATFSPPTSTVYTNGDSPLGFSSKYFLPTQMSPELAAKPSFCNKDNLAECVAYISEEMSSMGYNSIYLDMAEPDTVELVIQLTNCCYQLTHEQQMEMSSMGYNSIYPDMEEPDNVELIIQLTNCCYELIHKHQKGMQMQEEEDTRQMRVKSDFNHLQTRLAQTEDKLDQSQKDNVSLAEQCRQLNNRISTLQTKCKGSKEENKKLESLMKGRDTQFRHDLRKKERELIKLKDKVHQLMTDKNQERRIGMDILNSIQRTDGKRGTWKTGKSSIKHEEDMYRLIVTNYEERQKELMMENHELRESLSNMQKELVDLLNRQSPEKQETMVTDSFDFSETTSLCSSVDELSTGHFQMPFEMVREGIESSLRQKCQKLKEHIEQIERENRENKENLAGDVVVATGEGSAIYRGEGKYGGTTNPPKAAMETEIAKLKGKLGRYRTVIEQQENAMQLNVVEEDAAMTELIKDSQYLEEKELLTADKRLLQQQKVNFERERKNFTDAAIRLGQERKRFEEERASFLQQQMFMATPQMTSPNLRPPRSMNTSLSPQSQLATPTANTKASPSIVTPNQLISNKTPTTHELYRALKLVPDGGDCLNSSRDSLNSISQRSVRSEVSSVSSRASSTTPRSVRGGPPSTANSSRRSSASGESSDRRSTPVGCRDRMEEHKKNLRKTMAQRNTRKASPSSGGRKL